MQKITLLLVMIACLCTTAPAQDCSNFYFLQDNKTIEMSFFNKKGKPEGKQIYKVSNVKNNGGTVNATLDSEMFDKKGKSVSKSNIEIVCKDGVMMMDMKMMLPQQQQEQFSKAEVKADKVYIEYPKNMSVGDELKDGTFNMDMETGGMKQSVSMTVSNRKVQGKETVTTPAGSWDCYKITQTTKMNIKTMGIGIPMSLEGTEWFAPGFGVVKTESKHGNMEITAVK